MLASRLTARAAAAAEVPDSTAALAVASQKRRGRGVWLLILVLVLAAVAGRHRLVLRRRARLAGHDPAVDRGQDPGRGGGDPARPRLRGRPTRPARSTRPPCPWTPSRRPTPAIGEAIAKGATVQLLISTGPKPIPFGEAIVAGMPRPGRRGRDRGRAVDAGRRPIVQFDAEVAEGRRDRRAGCRRRHQHPGCRDRTASCRS